MKPCGCDVMWLVFAVCQIKGEARNEEHMVCLPLMVVNSGLCWFGIRGWPWTESTKMTIILHVSNTDSPCHGMGGLWKIFSNTKQMELLFCCWFLWEHSFSRLEKSIWALWRSNWIPLKMMCPGQKMRRQTGHVFETWRLQNLLQVHIWICLNVWELVRSAQYVLVLPLWNFDDHIARLLWIDPEVLAVVQDFWSFPDTLESGTCFSDCWKHVGTTCLSGQVEEGS